MYQLVPRIAARARSEEVLLTEASYTILIRVREEKRREEERRDVKRRYKMGREEKRS